MGAPVVHFEVHLRDDKNMAFHEQLFGWKIDASNPMGYGVTQTEGGAGIDGGISKSDDAPMVTFYAQVDDLQATLDRAKELGGSTVMEPTHIPGMVSLAMFADPDGNKIGIVLPEPPPSP